MMQNTMAISCFSIFLFICHALLLHSSQATNRTQPECPEQFSCGSLNSTRFPLTRSSQPDCGLLMVDCDAKPYPKLEYEGERYDVKMQDVPFLKIADPKLSGLLQKRSCQSFYRHLPTLITPSVTYRIAPILTLFRCNHNLISKNTTDHYFDGYEHHNCTGFDVYYKNPYINVSHQDQGNNLPPNCSLIQLPSKNQIDPKATDVFQMLSSEFFISWGLTENCSECHYKFRGQCLTDSKTNQFKCLRSSSSSSSRWRWILAAVLGEFGILLGISFIIWFLKKKTNWFSHDISRNTSANSILDRDSEAHSNYFGTPMFSYSELQEATNNFATCKELGDGAFGTVYHGQLRDGREVAVKRLYEFNHKRMELFINEVEILSQLRHKNLVHLYGCTSRHNRGLLVYEYLSNGTVADHLHGHRAKERLLTWPMRMNISVETAGALAYLHASDVVHRDVKTNNILLDDDFRVKVADFGLSRIFPDDVTHVSTAPQGTPGYVDPEYHECYRLNDKSDVYSFGVVLIELVSSMPAVDISRHKHEINLANFAMTKILRHEFRELIDPCLGVETDRDAMVMVTSVAELAFQCLQPEKEMRPSMDQVLETLIGIQNGDFRDWKLEAGKGNNVLLKKTDSPDSRN